MSWFKGQMSAQEGGKLPETENRKFGKTEIPFHPNYYNFEITGLSGRDKGKGITVLYWNICNKANKQPHRQQQQIEPGTQWEPLSLPGALPFGAVPVTASRGAAGSCLGRCSYSPAPAGALWHELSHLSSWQWQLEPGGRGEMVPIAKLSRSSWSQCHSKWRAGL